MFKVPHYKVAREAFEPSTPLRAANDAQRRQLLLAAPISDIEDLIPVLADRVKTTGEAFRLAQEELAEALLVNEAKKESANGC